MKMLFLFLPLLFAGTSPTNTPTPYRADAAATTIVWTGHKVTGQHTGRISLKEGAIEWDNGKLLGGSFTIDMTTITCTDLSGESAGKLVGHLRSPDFFDVMQHPSASYTITRAIPQDSKGTYKVIGNLTLKGITREVKFFATVAENNGIVQATGTITVDRSEFDVKFGSGSFFDGLGDKTIYDEFDLSVTLVARK